MLTECVLQNLIPRKDLALGVLMVEESDVNRPHAKLEQKLSQLLAARKQVLTPEEEKWRGAVRDLLRNGTYKPTGRGKPASEYLLRACMENDFPRVNSAVDIINYISLNYLVPVSLWDADLAKAKEYRFRLGKKGEGYVFNTAGQVIDVEDLLTGFAIHGEQEIPIVTPVKDSLLSKTTPQSKNVVMVVYYPLAVGTRDHLQLVLQESAELFSDITSKKPFLAIV
jgi:DNA/RNA-binding domain of Phe-tRNA-synthetase-like protein